jgi:hypothetical protein
VQITKRRILAYLGTAILAEAIESKVSYTLVTEDAKVWISCIDDVRREDGPTMILVV